MITIHVLVAGAVNYLIFSDNTGNLQLVQISAAAATLLLNAPWNYNAAPVA